MATTLFIIFILLIFSGFFSGSETGLTAANPAKIHNLRSKGHKRAILVQRLRERKEHLIGAILLGNNAVNIAASSLATSFAIRYFGDDAVWIVTLVMTLLVLIFAEVLPKTFAFRNPEAVSLSVAPIMAIIVKVLSPITIGVQWLVDYTLFKILRIKATDESVDSSDVLRGTIEMHHHEGSVVKDDKYMLGSILDLSNLQVEDIMVHRNNVEMVDALEQKSSLIRSILGSKYTRLPVYSDNKDNIIGVIHVKSLMRALTSEGVIKNDPEEVDFESIISTPWFVPDKTSLKDQLQAFRDRHEHMALVVDEYGEFRGMVTLEDIIEEIVGQIDDEYDDVSNLIARQKNKEILVEGNLSIRDLNREMSWSLPENISTTVAGLVINKAEHLPNPGQVFHFFGLKFEIVSREGNRITTIKIKKQ